MWQECWREANIVIDYLSLGESDLRIKNLVQVRNLNLAISDDEFGSIGHGRRDSSTSLGMTNTQAKNRSGESMGCGLQMRATQCSQLSWPLKISISTRRK